MKGKAISTLHQKIRNRSGGRSGCKERQLFALKEDNQHEKTFLLGIVICLFITLVGCNSKADNLSMYIEPAQLTEEEEKIAALLELNTEQYIFNFILDDNIQGLQVNTYELLDGEWKVLSGGEQKLTDTTGKIALGFNIISEGVRVAVQSEYDSSAISYASETNDDLGNMGYAISFLRNQTEIVYEQEIPLIVQCMTSENQISSHTIECFNSPEKYAEYEYVYAITVRFSQNTAS